jgi:hypothetical protein
MNQSVAYLRVFLLSWVLALVAAAPGRAGFIINGASTGVAPGGTATVDFTITSDSSSGDLLNLFNIELQISVNSGTSFLQFAGSQADFSASSGAAPYVFLGNSGSGAAFWGAPNSVNTANDTIAGGDFTGDASDVLLTSSSPPLLLAQIQVQADPHAAPGDSFQISLVTDPLQTYFLDSDGEVPYASTAATVVVEQVNLAPEPPSLLLLGTAVASGLLAYWGRRRKTPLGAYA